MNIIYSVTGQTMDQNGCPLLHTSQVKIQVNSINKIRHKQNSFFMTTKIQLIHAHRNLPHMQYSCTYPVTQILRLSLSRVLDL